MNSGENRIVALVCDLSSRICVDTSVVGIESFTKVFQCTVGAFNITPKAVATHLSRKGCPIMGRLSVSMETARSKGTARSCVKSSVFNLEQTFYLVKM